MTPMFITLVYIVVLSEKVIVLPKELGQGISS